MHEMHERKEKEDIGIDNKRILIYRSICRGCVKKKPRNLDGSRIYRPDRNFLDWSRICREAIETSSRKLWWIEIALTSIEKGRSRGSIDSPAVERYGEVIEKLSRLLKSNFSKKKKTQTWMQSNMLLNQRSKQHFKLSKTSLNKKNVKHLDPKHTHTHTHTQQV